MNPKMLCSFVDGSKAMIEMAALANTTGLGVSKRGMHGPPSSVPTLHQTFALKEDGGVLEKAGVVDYCTGPVAPGVFVVVRTEDPYVNHEMTYLQMGDGPYFALYRPYHLASIEAPLDGLRDGAGRPAEPHRALDRGGGRGDQARPQGGREDRRGRWLHGARHDRRLRTTSPATTGCRSASWPGRRLRATSRSDHLLTYDDVELDEDSVIVKLRRMQDAMAEHGVPSLDDLTALRLSRAEHLMDRTARTSPGGAPPVDAVDPPVSSRRLSRLSPHRAPRW